MVWPDGKRIAVMVTFDFDAELLRKSVIGKRTIGFSDTSRGQYGPDEGLKRCLDMLERQQLKTTFFVPGRIAELYADKVQQIADAGHELAYHGYLHEASVDMPAAEERENMAKSEELLEKVSGRKVVGYRGPLDLLPNCAMQLMAERGYLYGSTLKDCDWAYVHEDYPIVELPTEPTLDDFSWFYFPMRMKLLSPVVIRWTMFTISGRIILTSLPMRATKFLFSSCIRSLSAAAAACACWSALLPI